MNNSHAATLAAMVEATAHLSLEAHIDGLCRRAVEMGRELLGIDRLGVLLAEGDPLHVRGTFGTDEAGRTRDERDRRQLFTEDSPHGRVLLGLSAAETRKQIFSSDEGRRLGEGWLVLVPLIGHGERIIGVLSLDSLLSGDAFDEYTVELLRLYGMALGHLVEGLRSEMARREGQAIFQTLAETTTAALFILQDSRIRYANRAAAMLAGYTPEELMKIDFWQVVDSEYQQLVRERAAARQRGEAVVSHYEIKLRTKDGEERWVDYAAGTIQYEGSPAILGTAFDLTERRRAEYALRAMHHELRIARQIQERLCPRDAPVAAGFDVGGACRTARVAGGDYLDYVPLADGSLLIAVGDVSGHGLDAALVMSLVHAYVRGAAAAESDPGRILKHVNALLIPDIPADRFCTVILARLDPRARTLTYASAGHGDCYIFGAAGRVKATLQSGGLPVGCKPDVEVPSSSVSLDADDVVFLLTDGIKEALSPLETAFGEERALGIVAANRAQPAAAILDELFREVREFCGEKPPQDDITVAVIRVLPVGSRRT